MVPQRKKVKDLMDIGRFCIKFFARPGYNIDDAIFIDIFHEWIRLKKLPGILLDVADYRHVPEGPGVMLLTHDINFAMDYSEGRFGLFAQRKSGQADNHRDRILELVRATVTFGSLLEQDPRISGKISLDGGAFHYLSNDRLLAPNTNEAATAITSDLAAAAEVVYPGQTVSITPLANDPRERLAIEVTAESVDIGALASSVVV
jgi:hypothetical protein